VNVNQTGDAVVQIWTALAQLFAGATGGVVLALVVVAYIVGRRRK
jgi:hypothetical protein